MLATSNNECKSYKLDDYDNSQSNGSEEKFCATSDDDFNEEKSNVCSICSEGFFDIHASNEENFDVFCSNDNDDDDDNGLNYHFSASVDDSNDGFDDNSNASSIEIRRKSAK